jgi:hypothetical protein
MPTYHVYVNLNAAPVAYGASPNNPPVTGGVVVHTFTTQHPLLKEQDLVREAEQRTGPLRMEYQHGAAWEPGSETFAATAIGVSEGRSMGRTLGKFGRVRLVTAQGFVIDQW